jgi:glucose/arabinose dehydrogenase
MTGKRTGVLVAAVVVVITSAIIAVRVSRAGNATGSPGVVCPSPPDGAPGNPSPAVRTVATGLCVPWGLAFLPDGTALVTERDTAHLLSVTPDGRVTEVQRFPDVHLGGQGTAGGGEGGLLGLAVSPTYATDKWVYVYYATERDNRIAFGPDGMLYVGTGETYYERDLAQDRTSFGGKILRITPEGKPAPGNPFGDSPVYSLGHRNVQGLAWDSRGRLFAAELGEDRWDEVNLIEPGHNYGWPVVEGTGNDARFTNPLVTWAPRDASPSGIAIGPSPTSAGRPWRTCAGWWRCYAAAGRPASRRTIATAPSTGSSTAPGQRDS